MNKMGRDVAIDILRGIAILVVVFEHALQSCLGGHQSYVYDTVQNFQMPLFMFISGMSLAFSYPEKASFEMMKAKVIRFFPASLIWGYVLYFLRCLITGKIADIFGIINVLYASDFWFLRYLLIYQLIIIGIGCIIKHTCSSNRGWLFYLMPMMAVVLIKIGTYIPVVKYSMSSPLYLWLVAGLLFGKMKGKISNLHTRVMGIAGFGLVSVMTYLHILNVFYTFGVFATAWWIASEMKKTSQISNCLQYVGVRTLPIYAIHHTVRYGPLFSINYFYGIIQKYGFSLIMATFVLFLSWISISLIAEWIISKNVTLNRILFAKA